jgi:transcriptional regulator
LNWPETTLSRRSAQVYIPRQFQETDQSFIEAFIRRHAFATLISADEGRPLATHLLLDLQTIATAGWVLAGHIAKANPQWRTFQSGRELLAIFSGPHAYVSAGWYSILSAPTWNYVNVHVYGIPRTVEDHAELYELLKRLVDSQERRSDKESRYAIESMPGEMRDSMMEGIVGFEIAVTRIEAAAKLSQNRSPKDYQKIVEKLRERGDHESAEIAAEMMRRGRGSTPE